MPPVVKAGLETKKQTNCNNLENTKYLVTVESCVLLKSLISVSQSLLPFCRLKLV